MNENKKIRVVIADDHLSVRQGVRRLLEKSGNIVIVGEASNGKEAVQLVQNLLPDILILDLEMPVMGGIEALEILQREKCAVHVLILTGNHDPFSVQRTFDLGAKGYILKEDAPDYITSAVHLTYSGLGQGVSPSIKRMGFSQLD